MLALVLALALALGLGLGLGLGPGLVMMVQVLALATVLVLVAASALTVLPCFNVYMVRHSAQPAVVHWWVVRCVCWPLWQLVAAPGAASWRWCVASWN